MEYGFATHVVFWVIGAMTLVSAIVSVGACFSLGRGSYGNKS